LPERATSSGQKQDIFKSYKMKRENKQVVKYNKLVRDKIPQIIEKNGQGAIIEIASKKEYEEKLKEKLLEEVKEFLKEGSKEEFADILEVIHAIGKYKQFNRKEIEFIRKKKLEERGGFQKRIILKETVKGE